MLLFEWLAKPLVKIGVLLGGAVALWIAFASHYTGKGRASATAEVAANGEHNAQIARGARRDVAKLPDGSLHDAYFRD